MTATPKPLILTAFAIAIGVIAGWFAHSWYGQNAVSNEPQPKRAGTESVVSVRVESNESLLSQVQSENERISEELEKLTEENASLREANEQAEERSDNLSRTTEFITEVSQRLATDLPLDVPEGSAEAAVFIGQMHRSAYDFRAKWGDTPPEAGTPEADAYKEAYDLRTADFAAFMKVAPSLDKDFNTPAEKARFQSLQFYGALELGDDQWAEIDKTISRHYTDGFNRKLEMDSRPESGIDTWQQQRTELSEKAYNEVRALLTPEQRSEFERLYQPDFMWNIKIGG